MEGYTCVADAYEQHIRDAVRAEQLGYKYCFCIEHQNSPFAYITSRSVYLHVLTVPIPEDQRLARERMA